MICLYCKKEFISKRADAKFCSANCRKNAFRSATDKYATLNATDNVTDNATDKEMVKNGKRYANNGLEVRDGFCHACGQEQEDKRICICLPCIQKGITHKSLNLDINLCF